MGILICGLNGCGKSTLGRQLADQLGYRFIDNEDLYFPKDDPSYLYSGPRSEEPWRQPASTFRIRCSDTGSAVGRCCAKRLRRIS